MGEIAPTKADHLDPALSTATDVDAAVPYPPFLLSPWSR